MSHLDRRVRERLSEYRSLHGLAQAGVLGVLIAAGIVFYRTGTIIGAGDLVIGLVVGGLLVATALRSVPDRIAGGLGLVSVLVGLIWYLGTITGADGSGLWPIVVDTYAMMTGQSILTINALERWLIAVIPAPVFLAWSLALRKRYAAGLVIGGVLLGFLAMTGDASVPSVTLGLLGGLLAIGANELAQHDRTIGDATPLFVSAAVIGLIAVTISVPGGVLAAQETGTPGGTLPGGDETDLGQPVELEETLTDSDRLGVSGQINLSAEVRFRVTADEPRRWRTGVYDRYTGEQWVRTDINDQTARPAPPPGETTTVQQSYQILAPTARVPAAAKAVQLSDTEIGTLTTAGTIDPTAPLSVGTNYSVQSERPAPTAETLDAAGTEYPETIDDHYTQLPAESSDRVANLTAELTADVETPYRTAIVIEEYLQANKEYSLAPGPPDGPIADQFLFELESGYCVYYAGTMATMLRTQGVPARVAVGYNTGTQIDDNEWLVRGSDAHAWVEVYFPDQGWVPFDPTPAAPWTQARSTAIDEARQLDDIQADIPETEPDTTTATDNRTTADNIESPESTPTGPTGETDNDTRLDDFARDTVQAPENTTAGSQQAPTVPTEGWLPRGIVMTVILLGGVVAIARFGPVDRALTRVRVSWQPRRDPHTDLTRAIDRLETLLAIDGHRRSETETHREYLDRLPAGTDPRVQQVYEQYEQLSYASDPDRDAVTAVVRTVDELTRERLPLVGLLYRRVTRYLTRIRR